MNDKFFVGLRLTAMEDNGLRKPVSRVTLLVDNDNALTSGDDTGAELVADCPHATQAMVDSLLIELKGFQYHAYRADSASIDPAAELGDGVTVGSVYSIVSQISEDGSGYASLAAPGDAELEDEFPSSGPMTQTFDRKLAFTRSLITKTAEEIRLEVRNDMEQLSSSISIELVSIRTEISDTKEGLESSIEQTATSIRTEISDTKKGLESSIEQTATSLDAKISSTDDRVTSLSLDLDGIEARVTDAEGNISTLNQTATSLQTQITNNDGDISTLQQTATSIQSQVTDNKNNISNVKQYAESITLSVSNGETSSTITLKAGETTIASQNIKMTGLVTFEGLENGTTTIDGGCIKTGLISAARLELTGSISFNELSDGLYNYVTETKSIAQANERPEYIKDTYIDATTIRSPTIEANTLGIYGDGPEGGLSLYGYWDGRFYEMLSISYFGGGDYPVVWIDSPAGATIMFNDYVEFHGGVYIPE